MHNSVFPDFALYLINLLRNFLKIILATANMFACSRDLKTCVRVYKLSVYVTIYIFNRPRNGGSS